MQDAPAAQEPKQKEEEAVAAPPSISDQLKANVSLIEKAVRHKETRAVFGKLLRQTAAVRRELTAKDLHAFVSSTLPQDSPAAQTLQQYLGPQVRGTPFGGLVFSTLCKALLARHCELHFP